jgi:hypothetical protein
MLKRNLKFPIIVLLLALLLIPAYLSLVSSSSGYIRINGTSASVPNQQVPAGGNVSLYFGEITWDSSHLFLFLSQDSYTQISYGDFVYTPQFSVSNLTDPTANSIYSNGNGVWIVGNNWINGSIPPTVDVGSYTIKAVDEVGAGVAITDAFINVSSVIPASLQISPSSGPGGVSVQFTGSGYPASLPVTISYYDPTFGSWEEFATVNATDSGAIVLDAEMPDLRQSLGVGDYVETTSPISFRAENNGTVYSYVDYNQYLRGLNRVGDYVASGLVGNGTNLASSVRVEPGETIPISGKWFHPHDVIYVKWDGKAVVGTVTSDQWSSMDYLNSTIADAPGSFETTITIPDADSGEHYVAVEDSETRLIVKVFMSKGSLQISPSSGPGGISVEFTGSGYPKSSTVTISYLDSFFGTWNNLGSATADSLGNITFTTEMPDLRKSVGASDYPETYTTLSFRTEVNGSVYCYADYNEYARGLKRVGNLTATGLYGNGTNLASGNETIAVKVKPGDSLALSGKWFHSSSVIYVRWDGVAVVGTVTSDEWRNANIIGSTIASSTGSFSTSVTIPTADMGEHYLAVEDSEDRVIVKIYVEQPTPTPSPEPTSPPEPTPTPKQPGPTITVSCRSTTQYTGFDVEIYGTLSFNGVAASGESVLISYSVTGGSSWENLTLAKTVSDGGFLVVWKPSVTGNYLIKAKWEGNSTFNEASTVVNLALTPCSEGTVFSVTSNSTISAFAFNSTSKELSFTASGPSGTTGHVSVYIPKSLITDISALNVYLDENAITYNTESQGDSWVISFSYTHSEHKIVIALSAASKVGEIPTDIIIAIIAAVAIALIIVTAVALKKKRQGKQE